MHVQTDKPIVFLDLETTGVNVVTDRIVEIALIKKNPDGSTQELCKRVNPEMEIPQQASDVHGITNADVATEPTFEQLAPELFAFLEGCDLAGFNSNKFDIPLLNEEFLRYDMDIEIENRRLIDVQTIFHRMEQRTLVAAYKFYCDKDLEGAHSALADTRATLEVLEAQLDKYSELENNADFLHEFSKHKTRNLDISGRFSLNANDEPIFNFGKFKNQTVKEVLEKEPGYYGWMLNADFSRNTKQVLKKIKASFS